MAGDTGAGTTRRSIGLVRLSRMGIALIGIVLICLGVWGTGVIGGTLRAQDPQVVTKIVSTPGNSDATAKSTTETTTTTLAPQATLTETTSLAMLGLGTLLLLIAIAWDRIRKITGPGDWGLELADVIDQTVKGVAEKQQRGEPAPDPVAALSQVLSGSAKGEQVKRELVEAAQLERAGDPVKARQARQGALDLIDVIVSLGDDVARDRVRFSGKMSQIHVQDNLRKIQRLAAEEKPSREDVLEILDDDHPESRLVALATMLGHPESADLDLLIQVLRGPSSGEEIEMALRTSQLLIKHLTPPERARLAETLQALQNHAREAGDLYTPILTLTQLRDIKKLDGAATTTQR